MYLPRHFDESRVEVLHELIRQHPFGALVVSTAQGLEASHVPFEIDDETACGRLTAAALKKNTQARKGYAAFTPVTSASTSNGSPRQEPRRHASAALRRHSI